MTDTTHLQALINRLGNERARLAAATKSQEIEQRTVWVRQCEREINDEERFLGLPVTDYTAPPMSDDDLIAALKG